MSSRTSIERVRFAQGQRLPASDVEAALASELRSQELHVVAAHGTWGAGVGLRVIGGSAGAAVFPGVAYDAFGRSIVLTRVVRVALPSTLATEPEVDLVVGYAHGREPTPRFATPADVRPGLDIPLARFALDQGTLGTLDPTARKGTSSVGAPRIATGSTSVDVDISTPYLVYSKTVDTSVAGFRTTPAYVITPTTDATQALQSAGAIGPFLSIAEPTESDFRIDVRFGRIQSGGAAGVAVSFLLDVSWLGVEPAPRCEPVSFTSQ